MKKLPWYIALLLLLVACNQDREKLDKQLPALRKTVDFINMSYNKWPILLNGYENYCLTYGHGKAEMPAMAALDSINLFRSEWQDKKPLFESFNEHLEAFEKLPRDQQTYSGFLALCKELDQLEKYMDRWGTNTHEILIVVQNKSQVPVPGLD